MVPRWGFWGFLGEDKTPLLYDFRFQNRHRVAMAIVGRKLPKVHPEGYSPQSLDSETFNVRDRSGLILGLGVAGGLGLAASDLGLAWLDVGSVMF
eukprot:gene202-biopygen8929